MCGVCGGGGGGGGGGGRGGVGGSRERGIEHKREDKVSVRVREGVCVSPRLTELGR